MKNVNHFNFLVNLISTHKIKQTKQNMTNIFAT
jgi:hypothetical protein